MNSAINTNSRIADNNNNLNNNSNSNNIVKEDTSMKVNTIARSANTVSRFARRSAASLLAVGGLLALSHTAKADIVLSRFVPPAQVMGQAPGATSAQMLVSNTDNYTASNLQVTLCVNTAPLRQLGWMPDYADLPSSVFSLSAHESKWITIAIPTRGGYGTSLYGQQLSGSVWVNEHLLQSVKFLDVAPSANVQAGNVQRTGQHNGADVFTVTFTNNGYAASQAKTATVSTWLYADGQVGSALNQSVTIPALAVGASYTVTLTSQATQGDDIKGYAQVGTGPQFNFSL